MGANDNGSTPLTFPGLKKEEAHVWRSNLDRITARGAEYSHSADERARADKFHFQRDRSRFLAGRGVLRRLLAHYLDTSSAQIKFAVNAHGKPELKSNPHSLRFNISHSRNQALFAFCFERDIGVDIEWARPDLDAQKILRLANRFFTTSESHTLSTLEEAARRAAFFRLWTRKEALLKAIGTGVAGGLSQYEISLLAGEKPQILAPTDEAKLWSLFDLQVEAEYSGALAVRIEDASNFAVQSWDFDKACE